MRCGLHSLCIHIHHLTSIFHFDVIHILSQPLSVESDVGFGELKQRMIAQGEEVIEKYKKLVPESNLSEVSVRDIDTKANIVGEGGTLLTLFIFLSSFLDFVLALRPLFPSSSRPQNSPPFT